MTARRRPTGVAVTVVIVLLIVAVWWLQHRHDGDSSSPSTRDVVASSTAPTGPAGSTRPAGPTGPTEPGPSTASGLPEVALGDLPAQAAETVRLIDAGGPYPYPEDDGTFGNYEGLLPDEPRGYYREYTVETPGSPTRGARRIIAGDDGTLYWTGDHYASFAVIER